MAEANCKQCGKHFKFNPSQKKGLFCSSQCSSDNKRAVFIEEWKAGGPGGNKHQLSNHVRHYLLEQSGGACSQCGWSGLNHHTGRPCLEIDHIDDDPFNHSPENLQVVCPNCHAQKTLPPHKSKGGRYSKDKQHPKFLHK